MNHVVSIWMKDGRFETSMSQNVAEKWNSAEFRDAQWWRKHTDGGDSNEQQHGASYDRVIGEAPLWVW